MTGLEFGDAAMDPTFILFGSRPKNCSEPNVASSMQSLETSLFLTALGRHPHALISCASSIEIILQASNIGAKERDGLDDLLKKAKRKSKRFAAFEEARLESFRVTRNRIIHRGFSPQDDDDSVDLLLDVGFPIAHLCYEEFHSFNLLGGLSQEYSNQIAVARKVHARAKQLSNVHISYCVRGLQHLIRRDFAQDFSTEWEVNVLLRSEEAGYSFEHKKRTENDLERLFQACWSFDCPICGEHSSAVTELDAARLVEGEVIVKRMVCWNCGFVVRADDHFLSEVLLEAQIVSSSGTVLRAFGIRP